MGTTQLRDILSGYAITKKYFLDVFASDDVPGNIEQFPSCFNANVDSSTEPGSHCVSFHMPSTDKMEFFDSFGQKLCFMEVLRGTLQLNFHMWNIIL